MSHANFKDLTLSWFVVVVLVVSVLPAGAGDDPWSFNGGPPVQRDKPRDADRYPLRLLKALLAAVSAVDGDRCPMIPTCTQYAVEAMEKHGFFLGWIMSCARIIQEGDERYQSTPVLVDGEVRYPDPVTANDHWWRK